MKTNITILSVVSFLSLNLFAEPVEFHYIDQGQNYRCVNNKNVDGLNKNYLGECGDVSSQKISSVKLAGSFKGLQAAKTEFKNCDFSQCYVKDSNFTEADLSRTLFRGGYFYKATFAKASLDSADFSRSLLTDVEMGEADLSAAKFESASITTVSFSESNLTDADFTNSLITNVDFRSANLRGADFSDVNLGSSNTWKGATFNSSTKLPFSEAQAIQYGMIKASR